MCQNPKFISLICPLLLIFFVCFSAPQQARAEQEEEFISNTLFKKIQALQKEKETLAVNYEKEEEFLTNELSRKLMQVSERNKLGVNTSLWIMFWSFFLWQVQVENSATLVLTFSLLSCWSQIAARWWFLHAVLCKVFKCRIVDLVCNVLDFCLCTQQLAHYHQLQFYLPEAWKSSRWLHCSC